MRYTEKEYLKIGHELTRLISQTTTVLSCITGAFPMRHHIYRLANKVQPTYKKGLLLNFRQEFFNWYCMDFPKSDNRCKKFETDPSKHDQTPSLEGVSIKSSSIFFASMRKKQEQTTRKKPGLSKKELDVSISFFHHLGNRIGHFAIGAIERNFPASKATDLAREYQDTIQLLIKALQEELVAIEQKRGATNGI